MHRILIGLFSLIFAYVFSYLYIGLIATMFKELSGKILDAGTPGLFYPMILSTIISFYLCYNLINETKEQRVKSGKSIRVKAWIVKIIIGLLIIGTLTGSNIIN